MGCGCNKNKQNMGNTFAQGPGPSRVINTEVVPEFRPQTTEPPKNFFAKKLGMVQSFAGAIVSRGLANIKINKPTKEVEKLNQWLIDLVHLQKIPHRYNHRNST